MGRLAASACLALGLLGPLGGAGPAAASPGGGGEEVAIQVAEVPLERLGPLGRVPEPRLGLFAWRERRWVAVPFQIDRRRDDGRWLLEKGPQPDLDVGGQPARGVLVFMGRDLGGYELAASTTPLRYRVSGEMGPDERVMLRRGADWFALAAPGGGSTVMMTLDLEGIFARLDHDLYYRDDRAFADPPEAVPGQVPGVGFRLSRFGRLHSGQGVVKVIVALLDHLPADPARAAVSLRRRPAVSSRPVAARISTARGTLAAQSG